MRRALRRPSLNWLLVLVPLSLVAVFWAGPVVVFVAAALAMVPLAGLIGRSTDELARHAGPRVGGLLSATFANLAELIISVVLILSGEFDVVKASLIGSVLGNLLLVLGLSLLVGGLRYEEQSFNVRAVGVHATSMMLAVTGLLMPGLLFLNRTGGEFAHREVISLGVGGVLICLYVAALIFTSVTHRHLFGNPSGEPPRWPLWLALGSLLAAGLLVGLESELLARALEPTVATLGLPKLFVGLILIPLVGNAAENSAAISFALRNQVDIALEVSFGSAAQIALFVAPALVFISLVLGHPMDFVFSTFQVAAVGLATLIVTVVSLDGRSNWLEGAELLGAYAIVGVTFFYLGT